MVKLLAYVSDKDMFAGERRWALDGARKGGRWGGRWCEAGMETRDGGLKQGGGVFQKTVVVVGNFRVGGWPRVHRCADSALDDSTKLLVRAAPAVWL